MSSAMSRAGVVVIGGAGIGYLSVYNPETVYGVVTAAFAVAIVFAVLSRHVRTHASISWTAVQLGFGFRLVAAFAYIQLVRWFYGSADFVGYQRIAVGVGQRLLEGELLSDVGRRWLQLNPVLSTLFGLFYLVSGPALVGMFVLSAVIGFLGAYLVYRAAMIALLEKVERKPLLMLLFMLPSFVLWTSVLGKDSWMLFFIGLSIYSFANLLRKRRPQDCLGLVIGLGGVTVTRSAIGAILIFSLLCSLLFLRVRGSKPEAVLRPVAIGLVLVVAVPLFWKMAEIAAAEKAGEVIEQLAQEGGSIALALTKYHHGLALDARTPELIEISQPTLSEVIRYLPKGIFTLFFRPFLFEAHNALALVASLENTFLLVLFVARGRHLLASVRMARREPFLAFCWIAGLLLAAVISFAPNFGVLIRQRSMVLPFFAILLSVRSASHYRLITARNPERV